MDWSIADINFDPHKFFCLKLRSEPYVLDLGWYGNVVLYDTDIIISRSETSFTCEIKPLKPGVVSVNLVGLFVKAKRILRAPLFDVFRTGKSLWDPLGICPRLRKQKLPTRFWHSNLIIESVKFVSAEKINTLEVIYQASTLVALFVSETADAHRSLDSGSFCTRFVIPNIEAHDVKTRVYLALSRLASTFLTTTLVKDVCDVGGPFELYIRTHPTELLIKKWKSVEIADVYDAAQRYKPTNSAKRSKTQAAPVQK